MSEKSSEVLKYTLAATIEPVERGQEFSDGMPLHVTLAPPFLMPESRLNDLVSAYYNDISPWASLVFDDYGHGVVTEMSASTQTDIFGTAEHPVPVRRITLPSELETNDLLCLREMIKDDTEEVCGQGSTDGWVLGELHVSEGEHDLSVLDGHLAIDGLALFVKKNNRWRVEEKFAWVD